MITTLSIRNDIKVIKALVNECNEESAHWMEDYLFRRVLFYIASGVENSKELAQEALKCREIEYSRSCL